MAYTGMAYTVMAYLVPHRGYCLRLWMSGRGGPFRHCGSRTAPPVRRNPSVPSHRKLPKGCDTCDRHGAARIPIGHGGHAWTCPSAMPIERRGPLSTMDPERSRTNQNDPERFRTIQNDSERSRTIQNNPEQIQNDSEQSRTIQNNSSSSV